MKSKRYLSALLCAVLVLTLLPAAALAKDYSYYDFNISGDIPEGPDGLVWDDSLKAFIINPPGPSSRYHVTFSGTAKGDDKYCRLIIQDNTNVDIYLNSAQIWVPWVSGSAVPGTHAITIGENCNVVFRITGNNIFDTKQAAAGISVGGNSTVYIDQWSGKDPGYLYAAGSGGFPGIEVAYDETTTAPTLEIRGGTVTGTGGAAGGAGIGTASCDTEEGRAFPQYGGNITIRGGHVTGIGHYGAGIGGGKNAVNAGNILIEGGIVNGACSKSGGAGIGGGSGKISADKFSGGHGGNITIKGGLITANGAMNGAGIGGGEYGNSGDITITGGIVIARGNINGHTYAAAAGIGGGFGINLGTEEYFGGDSNNIVITGGNIFASSHEIGGFGAHAYDIGPAGYGQKKGSVIISNATSNTSVALRNNKLVPGAEITGLTSMQSLDYTNLCNYGLNLEQLYPTPRPKIAGTLADGGPHQNDWIDLHWNAAINQWKDAGNTNIGAFLDLCTIKYINTADNGSVLLTQVQQKGTQFKTPAGDIAAKTGYKITGWSFTLGEPKQFAPEETFYFNGDLTFSTVWTPNTYIVHYDANGGAGTVADATFTYDAAANLTANAFTRSGYGFAGWATALGGDVAYSDKQSVKNLAESGAVNLYAKWTPVDYTITYNLDGGTVSAANPENYTVESGEITLANPTKGGYTFAGWSGTGITGTSTNVTIPNGSTGNREYAANWTLVDYTITYHLDGGTIPTSNPVGYDVTDDAITLHNPTRTGYTFAGWSGTGITGTSTNVTIPTGATGDREYTANWTPNTYIVHYDANGGAGTMADATHTYDAQAPLQENAFTRAGYSFAGWATAPSGDVAYSDKQSVKNLGESGAVNLYAKWTMISYTITYNLDGGAVSAANPENYTVESGEITLANPTKGGYTFAGWSGTGITGTSTNVTIPNGSTGNREYAANWTPVDYTITYNLDGGAVSAANPENYTVESGEITLANPTREGYTFAGWSGTGITGTSTNVTIPAGATGDREYTANWTPNTYIVHYDANGGAGTMADATHTYDAQAPLQENAFTRAGYSFAGWATAPGGDVAYSDKQSVKNLGESGAVNLYAKWTMISYTITYNLDGGAVSAANPENYTVESGEITLANPTREGYTFAGWSGPGIDGKALRVTIPAGSMGNREYTANWTVALPRYIQRTLTDSATGVTVSGMIREDAVLTVDELSLGSDSGCEAIRRGMNDSGFVLLFGKNIALSQDFTGTLTMAIPVDSSYNGKTITVMHCVNGTLETHAVTVKDGKATFDVSNLSPLALFAAKDTKDENSGKDDAPDTGDRSQAFLWLLCGAFAVGGAGLALFGKRRRAYRK